MKRKLHHTLLIVLILLVSGCESMLSEHPVDKLSALYESSLALFMTRPNVTVSGRVVLCSLNDAGNPNVRVEISNIFSSHTTYTDSDGNFTFNAVKPGGYTVTASKQGHQFIPESQHVSVGGGGLNNVAFETSVTWEKTIGGSGWEKAYYVSQTNDCGYVVAGYTDSHNNTGNRDYYIIKLGVNGQVEWQKTYGGANTDIANSVQQTSDNNFIVSGYAYSYGAGLSDYYIMKLDPEGAVIWQKSYGGTETDVSYSIKPTSDAGYIVTGYTTSYGAGVEDFWLIKLDSDGNTEWDETYGDIYSEVAYSVSEVSSGGYILAGNKENEEGNYDIWIMHVNATGQIEWEQTIDNGNYDEADEIIETSEGGFIVAGQTASDDSNSFIVKLDSNGNIQWKKSFGTSFISRAYSIQQTTDGGYILAGCIFSYLTTDNDIYLIKTDSSGNVEWEKIFDGEYQHEDIAYSVRQTSDGGYILAGHTTTYSNKTDVWLFKLDHNGEIIQ